MTILLAVVGRVIFFQGPYQPVSALPDAPLLDMHCHTAGIGAGGSECFISQDLRDSFKFRIYLKSFGISVRDLEKQDDALLIKRISRWIGDSKRVGGAIILALDGVMDENGELDRERTEIYVPNEFVARETAKYGNLYFGASINPYRKDAIERLEWAKRNGAMLIKWIPSIQFINPGDERIVPFYEKMAQLDLPLLTHAGRERSFTHARNELADPLLLELPLKTGVKVIAAHIASTGRHEGERDIDRLLRMMPRFPNLYSDISSLTQINKLGYLEEALSRPEFAGRLMYGTDFPLINTPLVSPWYFPLNLTWKQMRRIAAMENPWDRDVALKRSLGVPTEVFARPGEFFGLENKLKTIPAP